MQGICKIFDIQITLRENLTICKIFDIQITLREILTISTNYRLANLPY